MNTYRACMRLGIWPMVKARAEVWSLFGSGNPKSIDDIKDVAKRSFRKLAHDHHPDKGGDHDNYLEIKQAFDLVNESDDQKFIKALSEEKASTIKYYEIGSEECNSCSKWSSIVKACMTITCSGFELPSKPRFKFAAEHAVK